MNLVDIGANLTHVSFENDFPQVVANAQAAGLGHIILTGTDLETSLAAQAMADQDRTFFSSTAGFHPHVASQAGPNDFAQIAELGSLPQVVAIGETGLDFNRDYSPRNTQRSVFEKHLELAAELQKPLFFHQRDAHEDFIKLLRRFRDQITGGVVHCFTDTAAALQDYLELDLYVGITGWICDERRGLDLQQHVRLIPADRLLIETDAPYLLPRSLRPKPKTRRNEPRHLIEVLRKIAECREESMTELAHATTENAQRLFRLDK